MFASGISVFLSLLLAMGGQPPAAAPTCSDGLTVSVGAWSDAAGIIVVVQNNSAGDILLRRDELPFSRFGRWTTYSFVINGVASNDLPLAASRDGHSPDSMIRIEKDAPHAYGVSAGELIPDAPRLPKGVFHWQWRVFPYCAQGGELLIN